MDRKTVVVIPAAGSGRRMGTEEKKQYLSLCGEPMVLRTARVFSEMSLSMIVVAPPYEVESMRALLEAGGIHNVVAVVAGGKTRQASIENALGHISPEFQNVLVHDAARCLVRPALVWRIIEELEVHGAVIPALPLKDTIKRIEGDRVESTLNRDRLVAVQTPQGFWREMLLEAYAVAREEGLDATDDASLVEFMQQDVHVIPGDDTNIKLTTPVDLILAESLLKREGIPCE